MQQKKNSNKKGRTSKFVYIFMSHSEDSGAKILGVFSTRAKGIKEWKKMPSFKLDITFGTGHTLKRHQVL